MATHAERLQAARDTIHFICSRTPDEMMSPVPNCPGWTVYNAAVHIGRVGVAWHSMIEAAPDDPDSRVRGYADAESRGTGHSPDTLASWALAAIDALEADVDRPCYFSMTGGIGSVGLWGWHVASELAVHRLDVAAALGQPHSMNDDLAADAMTYAAEFFLPAMARVTETVPGALAVAAERNNMSVGAAVVRAPKNEDEPTCTITGEPVDLLLALWGRPHGHLSVEGDAQVLAAWQALPATAFQFGTWD